MSWVEKTLSKGLVIIIASVAVCLLGIVFIFTIPITPFPLPASDHIAIQFNYPGASAASVQMQITSKVVSALKSINHVERIHAVSQPGNANIVLTLDADDVTTVLQTQLKINQAISSVNLPSSVRAPTISNESGRMSLLSIFVSSKLLSLFQISQYIQSYLTPTLSSLPGASIDNNLPVPEVKIQLDPEKIAQYHIDVSTLSQRVDESYNSSPLGQLTINQQPYELGLNNNISTLPELGKLVIDYQHNSNNAASLGRPIVLSDIAKISVLPTKIVADSYSEYNGTPAESINIITTTMANPFLISSRVHSFLDTMAPTIPSWLNLNLVNDNAVSMRNNIHEVIYTIGFASLLVLIIAFAFLGNLKTTLVPIITIPICLLGTIILITLAGYSINMITLLAMVIAVGLVVDDAIVVVENVTRHIEQGKSRREAVIQGTSELTVTIIGITATLIAVYLPIVFCHGPTITEFKNFSVPLASAVFISGIVALTLTPVMSLRLVPEGEPNSYQRWFSKIFTWIIQHYHRMLHQVLNAPYISLTFIIILITIASYFDLKIPKTFIPADPDNVVIVRMTATPQDTLESLKQKTKELHSIYQDKRLDYYNINIDKDPDTELLTAHVVLTYKPQYLHQDAAIADSINQFIQKNNIQNAHADLDSSINWGGPFTVNFHLYGDKSVNEINKAAKDIGQLMEQSPIFTTVTVNSSEPKKQLEFDINKNIAAQLGLYLPSISAVLSLYYGGAILSNYFTLDGMSLPVVLQLNSTAQQDPKSLELLRVQSPITQRFYPLNQLVALKMVRKPSKIDSFNNFSATEILANINKGYTIDQAMAAIQKFITQVSPTLHHSFEGTIYNYINSNQQTLYVFILGIVSIYFLLAIIFNSLLEPFIIMLTIPFTVVGGALSLYLIDGSINLFSSLGLITLIGLITKHGVLIVQMTNYQRRKGATVKQALLTATEHRFRPIIMTTLAMVLGALPLVLSRAEGYVWRQNLGIVIIGGLLIGTLFSLFIVPLVFELLIKDKPAHKIVE